MRDLIVFGLMHNTHGGDFDWQQLGYRPDVLRDKCVGATIYSSVLWL